MTRAERIVAELRQALNTEQVELIDDSHLHAGHAGAKEGKGHFRVRVVSADFDGLRTLQRHQLVYRSLGKTVEADAWRNKLLKEHPNSQAARAARETPAGAERFWLRSQLAVVPADGKAKK